MSDLTYDHCTFYRNAYNFDMTPLACGGINGNIESNLVITGNVFVNNGSHDNLSQEVPFSIVDYTNITVGTNYSVFSETMGWTNTPANRFVDRSGRTMTGVLTNSGDPLFVNARDPLGPDGLPFTDDDGLRPLPNSPIAVLGLGALPPLPTTQPIAHFRAVLASPGWKDKTGTNFNPSYVALTPDQRGGPMRPWSTPEALGEIPVTVTFAANQSIDGFGTNNAAITSYGWRFSDGGTVLSSQPTINHTFLTAGTNWVTLCITNSSGSYACYSNTYRTLSGTNAPSPVARPLPPTGLRRVLVGL